MPYNTTAQSGHMPNGVVGYRGASVGIEHSIGVGGHTGDIAEALIGAEGVAAAGNISLTRRGQRHQHAIRVGIRR